MEGLENEVGSLGVRHVPDPSARVYSQDPLRDGKCGRRAGWTRSSVAAQTWNV